MATKNEVTAALKKAAAEIRNLEKEKEALASEKEQLLKKVASLEEQIQSIGQKESESALHKKAEDGSFQFHSGGFGRTSAMPIVDDFAHLSAEERFDMILRGESPSDYQ